MSAEADELYSLLVPLVGERLLVPRACVAEVVRYSKPDQEAGAHSWMLGTVGWNGRELPVVTFEGTLRKEVPAATGRTRIVIFVASTGQLKTGYFGVLTQGFPQLVRVNRDVLSADPEYSAPSDRPILCRVRMIHDYPVIPDFETLEEMIAALHVA